MLNNLFLTTACATVFIGTLYPLALEVLTGDKISVGAPFFNLTFGPLFVPLMLAVPFGPLLAWKRGDLLGAAQRLTAAGIAALIVIAVVSAWTYGGSTFAPLAIGLAIFVIAGALCDLAERMALFRGSFATSIQRARGLPRATWGTAFAHAGVGVALIGIVCETTWNSEYIGSMKPDDVAKVAGYELKLDSITQRQGPNFREMIAQFTVILDGQKLSVMTCRSAISPRGILDNRGCAADARRQPALYLARRYHRRGRARGAHLSQAAGAADLVGPGADGVRRHAVVVGPKAARRCTEAREDRARISGGRVMRRLLACVFAVALMTGCPAAYAVQPDEIMTDPGKEARARDLSRELRCMVCQNQSIDDSEAPLARDLRLLVRERIAAGDSDTQVIDFLVARYGEFVLLKPRFNPHTLLLWLLPPLALVGGGLALWIYSRRRARSAQAVLKLTPEEEARLERLTAEQTAPEKPA